MSESLSDASNDERRRRRPSRSARRGFARDEFLRLLDDLQLKLRRLEERIEDTDAASTGSEGRFRALVEALPIPVAHLSALRDAPSRAGEPGEVVDFVCRYVNPAGRESLGWSGPESPIGRRLRAALLDEGEAGRRLFEACREVVETGRTRVLRDHPCRFRAPDGRGPGRGGRYSLHVGRMEDAVAVAWRPSRRSAAAADRPEPREAPEPLGDERTLILTLAHELKTPLNALLGFSDLLRSEIVGALNEAQKQQLERMRRSCRHLTSIVDTAVSAWSGGSSGKEIRPEDVDLREVVREVEELMELEAERKGIRLDVGGLDDPVVVRTDPGKVRQVLINLVSNAVKHAGAEVRVELEARNRAATRIRVSDDGPGIPEEHRQEIFEPYVRLDGEGDAAGEGRGGEAGLGLAVCRRLARLLDGEVTVESELGEGSTFTLAIPRS